MDIIKSKEDNVIKYIFLTENNQVTEFSYINKNDGKDIICVPSQTACNLKCKFCHLTGIENLKVENLHEHELYNAINYMINDLNLLDGSENKTLLISFMGAGEPLLNSENIIGFMIQTEEFYQNHYNIVRFAVASLIPNAEKMLKFTNYIKIHKINCKFHFSLHFTNSKVRELFMPASYDIRHSLVLLEHYNLHTNNQCEIHYTLIEDINDTNGDLDLLLHLVYGRGVPVKFLAYNEKEDLSCYSSDKTDKFRNVLEDNEIETEYYIPPGRDIGSSCGMFLVELYKKYNVKVGE